MKPSKPQIIKHARENLAPILVFIFVSVVTHLDGNVALIAGEGFGVYAFILLLIVSIRFISWVAKRSPEKIQRLKKTGVRFIYAAIICAISWQGIAFVHHRIDARFQPLIDKLEAYKAGHGVYPENTYMISGQSGERNSMNTDKFSGNSLGYPFCDYTLSRNDGHYCITCMTFGFNHHSYCSSSSKWNNWD